MESKREEAGVTGLGVSGLVVDHKMSKEFLGKLIMLIMLMAGT